MKAIKKRPFAFSCLAFIVFSYLFYFCHQNVKISAAVLSFILGATPLIFRKKAKYFSFYLALPILISSVTSLLYFNLYYNNVISNVKKGADIEFIILEEKYTSETFSNYTVKIESIDGEKTNLKANLLTESDLSAELFSVHSCKATIQLPSKSQNGFSSENYNLSHGIFLSAQAEEEVIPLGKTRKIFPSYQLHKINEFFSSVIDKYIPDGKSALSKALVLGNKSSLEPKSSQSFRLLGMSHILAVSGMHLTILIGSFDALLSKLKTDKILRCVTVISLTLFYAGITGFSMSVKRAAIMLILSALSFLLAKRHDAFTSLCFSGAFLCFIEPHALFDVGLQLSFLSTMGIITFASPASAYLKEKAYLSRSKFKRGLYRFSSALLFGIAPVMFSLPVTWLAFGEVALLSPVSNILFTPLVTLIIYSCPVMLITSFVPPVAGIISFILTYASVFTLNTADRLAHNAPIVSINYDFTAYIVAFLAVSLIILILTDTKHKFLFLIPFITCILAFSLCITAFNQNASDKIKAVYINNQDGDSFLIVSQGKALFCDISGVSYRTAKECEYYLGENHLSRLDSYLVTDYNGRGVETVEKLSCLTVIDKLLLPDPQTDVEKMLADAFIKCTEENNIECVFYNYEDDNQITFDGIKIDVKNFVKTQTNSPSSICVTFSNNGKKFSYIGRGCYSTSQGKQHLTKIFSKADSVVFGSYGRAIKNDEYMSLLYRDGLKLYFPSEDLCNSYRKILPKDDDICVTGEYYEFHLS